MKITLNDNGTVTVVMSVQDFRGLLEDAGGNEYADRFLRREPGKWVAHPYKTSPVGIFDDYTGPEKA